MEPAAALRSRVSLGSFVPVLCSFCALFVLITQVSFVMPSKYTKQTIPSPKDGNVTVREIPAHVAAALPFRGASPDEAGWAQRQRDLEEEIRANGALSACMSIVLYLC